MLNQVVIIINRFKNSKVPLHVLEVGCGTGQLSIYFSIGTNNEVVGLDPTIESLVLAKNFSEKNNISNIKLVNADIFDDVLNDNYFDFIWCNGVLHHTKAPYGAFKILIKSLKINGYVLIGLYNKYGRVRTIIRRYIYKIFGRKILSKIDYRNKAHTLVKFLLWFFVIIFSPNLLIIRIIKKIKKKINL